MVEPVARVEGLWKSYGGVPVLADVSIDLDPGEVHALVGGNGAGKSTLMKAISGAVAPDAGTITIGGRTTHGMSLRQAHASNVYMVPQEPQLFGHLSVYENVSIALDRRVSRADVAAALAKLSSPINLDSRAHDLSISDQQLVELCRGILREAKVLIVDEPTAALTAKEVGLLFAQLRRMAMDGVGIFYVSHRLSEIFALCDRVTVMRDGRVASKARRPSSVALIWSPPSPLVRRLQPLGPRQTPLPMRRRRLRWHRWQAKGSRMFRSLCGQVKCLASPALLVQVGPNSPTLCTVCGPARECAPPGQAL